MSLSYYIITPNGNKKNLFELWKWDYLEVNMSTFHQQRIQQV